MTERVYNFSPGPAVLPLPVLEEAQRDLVALPDAGMSILEISHRSPWFKEIHEQAEVNLRDLLKIPEQYKVLFLQGGANLQFSMVAMNLLRGSNQSADYILTGSWGKKAIKEAEREGTVNIAWSGESDNFKRVPKQDQLQLNPDAVYAHFTSNETIQGVEFQTEPDTSGVPLICDASSDILSRPIPIENYSLIYAGAQKNAGPSGVTLVILREDLLERISADLHSMLDYRVHCDKNSTFNTPPVFPIYTIGLVTKWLMEEIGGLEKMEAVNRAKAQLLYDAIDQSKGFYIGHADPDSRSLMNVTWVLKDESLLPTFIEEAKQQNLYELKGHRSVGGFRASIYNAMPMEGVQCLRDFMVEFQKRRG